MCCLSHGADRPAARQTCLTLQTHSAISTSLTSNRSSYQNLKLPLQSTRVRPYSTTLVGKKKRYTTGPCANRSFLNTGLVRKVAAQFCSYQNILVPSAAISLLPRHIHVLLWREAKKITESQKIRT